MALIERRLSSRTVRLRQGAHGDGAYLPTRWAKGRLTASLPRDLLKTIKRAFRLHRYRAVAHYTESY
jgi:hypothetical protein